MATRKSTPKPGPTAKEKLQSSGEEPVARNDELHRPNAELNLLTHDLSNLPAGIDIPLLVLDAEWRVRRFTPMAGELLRLIAGDVGRPFSDLASTLNPGDCRALFAEVESQGRPVTCEVAGRGGQRYTLRICPCKTDGSAIAGFVLVLLAVDAIDRSSGEAPIARDPAIGAEQLGEEILNSLTAHVAVIGRDGTILVTNEAWNRFARENGDPPLHAIGSGVNYLDVCRRATADGLPEAQTALECLERVLEGRSESSQMEYPCDSDKEERWFLMNVSRLQDSKGGAVVAHVDITRRKLGEIATQASESMIRALLDSSAQSVIVVGEDRRIEMANAYSEGMFGYPREELLGLPIEKLIPEESRERHAENQQIYFADLQSRPMGIGMNLEACRKDGTRFPVEIGLSGIRTPRGRLAVAIVSDITQRRQLEQAAATHTKEVEALAARLLTVQEEERRRVSRELHDQICQQLASLAIDISGYAATPSPSAEERERRLKDLYTRVVKASETARHLAYELHPSVLDDLGLVASLRALCRQFSRTEGIAVKFDNAVMPAPITREIASCAYRVAQESLQNIARHSGASKVSVRLKTVKTGLSLSIADNGVGFDVETARGGGGLGLIGMEERTRLVGGKLSITATPRRGTRLALEMPLTAGKP
jgi:PAS domain S-box-containing protein